MAYPTYSDEPAPGAPAPSRRARLTAFGAAGAVAVVVASLAFLAGTAVADDPAPLPTYTPSPSPTGGNVSTCEGAGLTGELMLFGEAPPPPSDDPAPDDADGNGNIADVSADGKTLTVTIAAGWVVSGIVVKGGDNYNIYYGPFVGPAIVTGLISPPVGAQGNTPKISHYLVCGDQDTTSPSPSGSTSPDPSDSASPDPSESTSPDPSESTSPVPSTSTDPGELPKTGNDLTGLIAIGLGLVAGGATLLLLRRRREVTGE